MDDIKIRGLIDVAIQAREKAYAPYSGFRVGAALLGGDGAVYLGCNVENAVYGAGICAERAAVCRAVSDGVKEFRAVAVVGDTGELCSPCGICRQVIMEFGPDILVIRANDRGDYVINPISDLLPGAFTKDAMDNGCK